jgi:dissimilatory sulfite reductase (desulfoviridin) alpha/beta subunit
MGTPLSRLVTCNEVLPILEKTILWFKENGEPKERLGKTIDRIGIEKAESEILGDEILSRKDEILAK